LLAAEENFTGLAGLNRELIGTTGTAPKVLQELLLLPVIERLQKQGKQIVIPADAAFAKRELYQALEERG
jgi:hypothetical protein